ncbi:MAG TPA: polysaccharide deacetylase family protein [Termitinemataceae bacterium]|nr:polysaccharide deacetylase family protein [Termitinemataceae bacterium]HOM22708.1 polysaccharide deacetylase family protein [Termitinemataceae bacterium]HPP99547.1 polysaccharide deacetylase family protein [Termitinemataceae bacterium]
MKQKWNGNSLLFMFFVGVLTWGQGLSLSANTVVSFEGLDLSSQGEMLFRIQQEGSLHTKGEACYALSLSDQLLTALTVFPDRDITISNDGKRIFLESSFGVYMINEPLGLPQPLAVYPHVEATVPFLPGEGDAIVPSPDGRWILFIKAQTAAFGTLCAYQVEKKQIYEIATGILRGDTELPARWSPDSRTFVYERNDRLYYHSVAILEGSLAIDERYRLVGEGHISRIFWDEGGNLYYIKGTSVYRTRSVELSTRSVYADFLPMGTMVGTLPFNFDDTFDSYWIGPEGKGILFLKDRTHLFYYPLRRALYYNTENGSFPYVTFPASTRKVSVFWSKAGIIWVLLSPLFSDGASLMYRLNLQGTAGNQYFTPLEKPFGERGALSPDEKKLLLWGKGGALVLDFEKGQELARLSKEAVFHAQWLSDNRCVYVEREGVYQYTLGEQKTEDPRTFVALLSASRYGFDAASGKVLMEAGGRRYTLDDKKTRWIPLAAGAGQFRQAQTSNETYRVYLETQESSYYRNFPMVRFMKRAETRPVFPKYEAPRKMTKPYLSLVFDLMEQVEGLPEVLEVLERYGIRSTFFVNGEFVRKYPEAAADIARRGHEVGNLFFAPINMADRKYTIDGDFIKRGLARNEDEYFKATGFELSPLWHAPFYVVSSLIEAAAQEGGYRTVRRDLDPLDWVGLAEQKRNLLPYRDGGELVETIISQAQPGFVIPIALGKNPEGRRDYLFQRLDLLVRGLKREGYQMVPVSRLVEEGLKK